MTLDLKPVVLGALTVALLTSTPPAYAQAPAAPVPTTGATLGIAASYQRSYAQLKRFITSQAERMPEADYAFRPTPDVKTFGQLMGHIADYNYIFCNAAHGGANPMAGTSLETKATKAELLAALAASFAYCDEAFGALTDTTALEMVTRPPDRMTKAGSLIAVLIHGYEEYGYTAVYARIRGVVPPSTAP